MAATIERCIAVLSDARLDETAMLLSIARLDLLARLNGVSEREIEFIRSLRSDKEESRPAH